MFEDVFLAASQAPERVRQRVRDEIQRLVDLDLLESGEAEVLKERFRDELDRRVQQSREAVSGLSHGLGSAIREVLDLPSRSELRQLVDELEAVVRAAQSHSRCESPLHDPGRLETPGAPIEVLPGITTWSSYVPERGLYFNSYALDTREGLLAVDPVDPGDDASRNALLELGELAAIVVTNRNHSRAAPWLAKATKAEVWAGAGEVIPELEVARRLTPGELVGGWRVLNMAGKSPGEIGLLRPEDGGQLLLGDALIGHPPGQLAVLPDEKLDDPKRLRRSLRELLEERFDALLLCDGVSILAEADSWTHSFLRSL